MDTLDPTNPDFEISVYLAGLHLFEDQLGVKRGTLFKVSDEDDWSMVIKCHALIEASITFLLTEALDKRLAPVVAMLELGNPEIGKLEFVRALELLTTEQRKFVRELSKLRNLLAHDPGFIGFTLKEHMSKMDKNQKKAFLQALAGPSKPEIRQALIDKAETDPKAALLVPVLQVILAVNAKTLVPQKEHLNRIAALMRQYLRSDANAET